MERPDERSIKIDDFFVRCQLASFDSRAIAALNREEKEYYALAAQDLELSTDEIRRLPLAHIEQAFSQGMHVSKARLLVFKIGGSDTLPPLPDTSAQQVERLVTDARSGAKKALLMLVSRNGQDLFLGVKLGAA